MRTVCWRLAAGDADIASVRYRCLIPGRHLKLHGVGSRLSWGRHDPLSGPLPDVLVFVKSFADEDLALARQASRIGVPILVDVCDNVFAAGYRATSPDNLREIARLATGVVTTGPALARVLRRELGPEVRLHEIPDPVETLSDVRCSGRMIWAERVRSARVSSPQQIVATFGGALRNEWKRFARLLRSARPDPAVSNLPQVIWFGNVGSTHPRFGLINLVDIADELVAAARAVPFRLLVVSGDREAYATKIDPLPLETAFVAWDRTTIFRHLQASSVAIVPNSQDEFSVCKSANRAVLALTQGVPVVATRIPSMEPLEDAVALDDFRNGVVSYLRDRRLASEHVARAERLIEQAFSGEHVGQAWLSVLEGAVTSPRGDQLAARRLARF